MAEITINEVSQNYTYNIGNNSYATVALPITSSWGPGFEDPSYQGYADDEALESVIWTHFPATQSGLESFVSTFRGAATQSILHQDHSYEVAMSLLTSGYDLLVSRIATGRQAQNAFLFTNLSNTATNEEDNLEALTEDDWKYLKIVKEEEKAAFTSGTYTRTEPVSGSYISYQIIKVDITSTGEGSEKRFKKVTVTKTYTVVDVPFNVKAKYLGSFGNNLVITLRKLNRIHQGEYIPYWNCIVYVQSTGGIRTAVENLNFVFDVNHITDSIVHIDELSSNFITFVNYTGIEDDDSIDAGGILVDFWADAIDQASTLDEKKAIRQAIAAQLGFAEFSEENVKTTSYNPVTGVYEIQLLYGSDLPATASHTQADLLDEAITLAQNRFSLAYYNDLYINLIGQNKDLSYPYVEGAVATFPDKTTEIIGLNQLKANSSSISVARAEAILFREWMFTAAYTILGTLSDKLAYHPNRIIVPGWDDQDYRYLRKDNTLVVDMIHLSPLHMRLMDLAYLGRCATSYIDIPRSISRKFVYNESLEPSETGYAQRLARHQPVSFIESGSIYASHSALFAPWGKYTYAGTLKQSIASPSFLALVIDRAMIKNQAIQYEWVLPDTRKHNLKIGKMDYTISKKYLDEWQSIEGVGINCITNIPDMGLSIWGNSTLYEVPPATYQALANLSTRKLVNAIEDLAYRCGISITFHYNNEQAYNAFYAGMTPLLDTARNVGAIEDYYLRMAADINGLDQVNANSVIGKIYLIVEGVVNNISIDLVALPPSSSLDDYRA